MKTLNKYYDFLIENEIATENEVNLVTNINGYNIESFNNILYCKTGYRTKDQYLNS